ncbi:MAG TPA: sugar phosphate nucleotidyltransferase [Planctomycetota bacterium]|nr:sugar phosphate nucleotidyltransferase [Planctomycetota bacterium]
MERVILLPGRTRAARRALGRRGAVPETRTRRLDQTDTRDAIAIVLGGGRGNRLLPLTRHRCKPDVPVGGTYRLVDISISNSLNSGIDRVFVLTQFNSASLHSHIAQTYRFDPFGRGYVEILAAEQTETSNDWYQGTADAVRKQLHRLMATGAKEAVILSGDHLYRMDLRGFVARHRAAGADVTVGVTPVPLATASRFGLLRADEDDMIVQFAEKPKDPALLDRFRDGGREVCLASMGIYVFKLEVLARLLEDPAVLDFGMHAIPRAVAERPVAAHRFAGYWQDLGTIGTYHGANVALARGELELDLFTDVPFYGRPRLLPPSRIHARVRSSLIADGCVLEDADIASSVVGPRTVVGAGSRLDECISFGATSYGGKPTIGAGCVLRRVILDEDAKVGDGAVLENRSGVLELDAEHLHVRDGIIIISRGATVPAGFVF